MHAETLQNVIHSCNDFLRRVKRGERARLCLFIVLGRQKSLEFFVLLCPCGVVRIKRLRQPAPSDIAGERCPLFLGRRNVVSIQEVHEPDSGDIVAVSCLWPVSARLFLSRSGRKVFPVLLFYLLLVPLIAFLKLIVRAKSIEKRRIDPALVDLYVRDFFAV